MANCSQTLSSNDKDEVRSLVRLVGGRLLGDLLLLQPVLR